MSVKQGLLGFGGNDSRWAKGEGESDGGKV
jgi:hypothetical protein